jgi:CRP-like cAMP-binding protein
MADLPHLLEPFIRKLEAHAELSEEDRAAVFALPATVRTLDPAAYLVREGDPPVRCGILASGFAFRQKHTGAGQRQIIAIHIPGDAVDFQNLFLDVADHSVQMLTRGQVVFVARSDFRELARARPQIAQAIMTDMLIDASIFREWVLNVGRRDARTRMAHLLCEFAVRMRSRGLTEGDGYELPITQEQLADALGLTPVHINRTLKVLEADGLVVRNKRSIAFPSWQRMEDVADFNRRYLHLERIEAMRLDQAPGSSGMTKTSS